MIQKPIDQTKKGTMAEFCLSSADGRKRRRQPIIRPAPSSCLRPLATTGGLPSVSRALSRPLRLLCANKGHLSPVHNLPRWKQKDRIEPCHSSTAESIPRHTFGGFWNPIQSNQQFVPGKSRHHNRVERSSLTPWIQSRPHCNSPHSPPPHSPPTASPSYT